MSSILPISTLLKDSSTDNTKYLSYGIRLIVLNYLLVEGIEAHLEYWARIPIHPFR